MQSKLISVEAARAWGPGMPTLCRGGGAGEGGGWDRLDGKLHASLLW